MRATTERRHTPEKTLKGQLLPTEEVLRLPLGDVLNRLSTSEKGLGTGEAERRLTEYGANDVAVRKEKALILEFFSHFMNPLVLILVGSALISSFLGEHINSTIILVIVVASVALDFLQEHRAEKAAEELQNRVATTTAVLRDNLKQEIRVRDVVPGDVIVLAAGDIIPADARVASAKDFFAVQSALTGESFPAEKTAGVLTDKDISDITTWRNYLFMGTSVASGTATAVVARTGAATEYGDIIKKSVERKPVTEFERGIRRFGFLIMRITFILVIFVFFVNAFFKRGVLESLLFAVALAVGLTPELLPMILSINLASGAIAMSKKGAIVKRLSSIQDFGSMDILCTDKTGTLTENRVTVILHVDLQGSSSDKVFLYTFLNSYYQTGLRSPLDEAVLTHEKVDTQSYRKVDEIPFDFVRRKVSVVVDREQERFLIAKGAAEEVIRVSTYYELGENVSDLTPSIQTKMRQTHRRLATEGYRVLGIAYKKVTEDKSVYSVGDECNMVFLGFIAFVDPPKETARESIKLLMGKGIDLKILTGDNELVTRKICEQLDFEISRIVLGSRIDQLDDNALARVVEQANIFARVNPAQKNRIMNALKGNGHVVGYIGDGINDTPSMKVSDVSISVENAVDIAKESADIILLHKDLTILGEGVSEGRKTFANTVKYIFTTTSANFGNMVSMAGLSLFLPFLPLLPTQILLNNFLSDIPASAIATDCVDDEMIEKPTRWDMRFIQSFMVVFGLISSAFDYLTFAVLLFIFHDAPPEFRTGWFFESLMTELFVALVVRTRRTIFRSRPGKYLLVSTLIVAGVAIVIPYLPFATLMNFTPLPPPVMIVLIGITVLYVAAVEVAKKIFYARVGR